MPREKTLEEKLEEASSAVERALEARDKAIQDLMEAKMAYGEVWRKLHDKSQAPVPDDPIADIDNFARRQIPDQESGGAPPRAS
jgi:hypothetical protein